MATKRRMIKVLGVALTAALATTACGGGGSAGDTSGTSSSEATSGSTGTSDTSSSEATSGSTDTSDGGESTGSSDAPVTADKLTVGVTIEPLSWDPAQAEEGPRLPFYQGVYDTLLLRNPDGSLAPMLAESWEVSDDLLSVTLKLRSDVTFTDGSTFDSSVVKANLERFKSENGPQAVQLATLDSVETPDPTTAIVKLSAPNPSLLTYLGGPAGLIASADALADPNLKTTPVGSGPYTLDAANTNVGVKYSYQQKPDYWGTKMAYATVEYLVLPDAQAQLNALKSGQLNATVFFGPTQGAEAEAAGFQYWPVEVDYMGFMLFDRGGEKIPALGDVRVRQAINYAVDSEALLKTFILDRGSVTSQIWGTASGGYEESLDSAYPYDPEKAKQLLAEAGYADGFAVEMPTAPAFDPALMAALVQMLADVNITATLTDVPMADFFKQLRGGEWPMTFMRFAQPSDWQLINQFLTPVAPWNPFKTTDDTAAGLISEVQNAKTPEEGAAAAKQLNQHIVDEAWFAPFYRVTQQTFSDDKTIVTPQAQQAAPSFYNYAPKG